MFGEDTTETGRYAQDSMGTDLAGSVSQTREEGTAMARVLVHYDIPDDKFRAQFQTKITSPTFVHPFSEETESVYCTTFDTTEINLKALVQALTHAATGAPPGSHIIMEHPEMVSNQPEILRTVIV